MKSGSTFYSFYFPYIHSGNIGSVCFTQRIDRISHFHRFSFKIAFQKRKTIHLPPLLGNAECYQQGIFTSFCYQKKKKAAIRLFSESNFPDTKQSSGVFCLLSVRNTNGVPLMITIVRLLVVVLYSRSRNGPVCMRASEPHC